MSPTPSPGRSEGPIFRIGLLVPRPGSPLDAPPLRETIRTVLRGIRAALDNVEAEEADEDAWDPLRFVILSALADGPDRVAVDQGLKLGYELTAVLPLARDEYERELADGSGRDEYHALLARATHVDELPGDADTPDDRRKAYASLDAWMIEQSDLLLAIWDDASGAPPATAVADALAAGRPVVQISTRAPHETCRLQESDDGSRLREDLEAFLLGVSRYGL